MSILGPIGGFLGLDRPTNPSQSSGQQIGLGFDSASQSSSSFSRQNPAIVWPGQAPYLENLYQQAQAFLPQAMQQGSQLFEQGMGVLNTLFQPQQNPYLGVYANEVQNNLQRNILPAIANAGVQANQLGGSRQGIAQGLAASEANQQITDMAARLYSDDMNRMLAAAQQLPAMLGLPWYGLSQMAGILGRPTVLDQGGYSESSSAGSSMGQDFSFGTRESSGGGGGGSVGGGIFDSIFGGIF